ncbi:MAG: hypothetical protein SNI45_05570 [Rikenellaceae bacterium]
MKKKIKTVMTAIIAVQSAIEIAQFLGKTYTSYRNRNKKRAASQEQKSEEEPQTTQTQTTTAPIAVVTENANDQVREN